jgi:hypothetical protein
MFSIGILSDILEGVYKLNNSLLSEPRAISQQRLDHVIPKLVRDQLFEYRVSLNACEKRVMDFVGPTLYKLLYDIRAKLLPTQVKNRISKIFKNRDVLRIRSKFNYKFGYIVSIGLLRELKHVFD